MRRTALPVVTVLALVAVPAVLLTATALADAAAAAPSGPVSINEVESNGDAAGDWIELTSMATDPVDLSGWVLRDSADDNGLIVPDGTVLAPGGYVSFVTDANDVEGSFGLGGSDSARLFDAAGDQVDAVTWTAHAATTLARCPDGTGPVVVSRTSTRDAANDCAPATTAPPSTEPTTPTSTGPTAPPGGITVAINEVESNGDPVGDWVELINLDTAADADLSGYVLKDSEDDHSLTLPTGSTVESGGYLAVYTEPSYGLGGTDAVRLFAPDGTTLVDSVEWSGHAVTSYGRCPDGTGDIEVTAAPTRGLINDCGPGTEPVAAVAGQPGGGCRRRDGPVRRGPERSDVRRGC